MARRGFPNATLRLDPELWRAFGRLADDRSAVLRDFIRWYVREPGAKMPRRSEVIRSADGDQESDLSPSRS